MKIKNIKALLDTFNEEAELVLLGKDSTIFEIEGSQTKKNSTLVWLDIRDAVKCDGC